MRPSPLTARSTPLKTLSVERFLASSAGSTWASAAGQGARATNSASSLHRWRSRLRTDTEPRASGRITLSDCGANWASGGPAPNPNEVF